MRGAGIKSIPTTRYIAEQFMEITADDEQGESLARNTCQSVFLA